ncbi:MAG: tetratricopeptide repeat protein, partial [Ignavibacteria bacterium]|nr:tetratricopeptide repeat protein [Ignavibacteria bacterium]
YSLGNIQLSIESYLKSLELNPESFEGWSKLAETYGELGMWLEGMRALDECIRINPNDANSYYEKAKIYFLLNHTKEAIDFLKLAFKIDPSIKNNFSKDYPEVKLSKLFNKLIEEN